MRLFYSMRRRHPTGDWKSVRMSDQILCVVISIMENCSIRDVVIGSCWGGGRRGCCCRGGKVGDRFDGLAMYGVACRFDESIAVLIT